MHLNWDKILRLAVRGNFWCLQNPVTANRVPFFSSYHDLFYVSSLDIGIILLFSFVESLLFPWCYLSMIRISIGVLRHIWYSIWIQFYQFKKKNNKINFYYSFIFEFIELTSDWISNRPISQYFKAHVSYLDDLLKYCVSIDMQGVH